MAACTDSELIFNSLGSYRTVTVWVKSLFSPCASTVGVQGAERLDLPGKLHTSILRVSKVIICTKDLERNRAD